MESIRKTTENVERRFGEALGSRDTALTLSEKKPGLGPPDMCWLQKRVKKAFRKRVEVRGSYHWVLGKDMCGEHSAAEYLTGMVNGLEKPGFLQGLVPREYSIERGVYCCNDPFGLVDIWCDVETGGKMMARAIDSQGEICEVTPNMWRGARLGCFLRSELYDGATTMSMIKLIRRLEQFQTQQAEEDFMDSTLQLYKDGVVQENLQRLQWDKGEGLDPEDMDIVAGTILHYFRRSQRWQKALQFFTRLQEIYPPSAVYLAAVYRELDNPDGAITVLKTCVEDRGHTDTCLLVAYGNELLLTGNVSEAFVMAKKSIGKAQTARPAWVLLQGCFSANKDYTLSLKTLNFMPGPAMPPHDKDLLFPMLPPKPKSVTKPHHQQYSPDAAEFRKLSYEMKNLSCEQVDQLPAEILAPEQYGNSAILGHCAPMYCTRAAARKAYRILLNIVREVGWEEFIEMRSQLFTVADVSLQGHTSALSKARESINLAAHVDKVHVHLKIIILENNRSGDNVLKEELVSVSLEVTGLKNLPASMASSPSSLSSTKVSIMSSLQAGNESNNPPSEFVKDHESLNEKENAVENNSQVEDETTIEDQEPTIVNGTVDTAHGEEVQEGALQNVESTSKGAQEPRNQHETPPKPPVRAPALPKGAFQSAEYVEKLKSRSEGNFDENVTPRPSQVSTPRLTPKLLQDNRKDNLVPPASPMSSKGSQTAGTSENGDRWLVRVVSHGIKDRVRYFESMASKKQAEEESKIPDEKEEAAVQQLKPVSSRKGNSMTMMEFFTAGWDESTVGMPEDPALLTGGSAAAEGSEADGSVEEEVAQEDGTADDTASRLVVKKGWLSVDWSSRQGINSDRRQASNSTVGDLLREDSQPTSPLMEEVQTQGLESVTVRDNDHSNDSDGIWIVRVLEELQECKCSDWLDEIILALWEDLAMYTELRKIDRKWKARTGKAQAELILGTEEENYSLGSEDDTPRRHQEAPSVSSSVSLPKSTSGDWMRRGMLCERLERIPEAEQAYRVCLFKSFNLTALLGLSRIYASWGWSKEAMQVLNRLAEYHDRCHDFARDPYIPQSIARAINQLVTSVGNMEVRSCAAKCHPMVKFAVDNILNWQLRGGLERRGSQQQS